MIDIELTRRVLKMTSFRFYENNRNKFVETLRKGVDRLILDKVSTPKINILRRSL